MCPRDRRQPLGPTMRRRQHQPPPDYSSAAPVLEPSPQLYLPRNGPVRGHLPPDHPGRPLRPPGHRSRPASEHRELGVAPAAWGGEQIAPGTSEEVVDADRPHDHGEREYHKRAQHLAKFGKNAGSQRGFMVRAHFWSWCAFRGGEAPLFRMES